MAIQSDIELFGKLLSVILDLGAFVPGLNIPIASIKLVEDGVQLEEAAYTLFETPAAAPLRDAVNKLAAAIGMHPIAVSTTKTIKVVPTLSTIPTGYRWDVWQGWVKD